MTPLSNAPGTGPPRLVGAPNFRDFGGGAAIGGRLIRRGVLYRSDALSQLTDSDLQVLRELRIGTVCDLRGEIERKYQPARWPEGLRTEWLSFDLSADPRAGNARLRKLLADDPGSQGARRMMIETYRLLPQTAAAGLRHLFQRLAQGTSPILVHCTAGKDRTGFVCACVLSALGASRDSIYADYLLSGERLDVQQLSHTLGTLVSKVLGFALEEQTLSTLNGVSHEYLDAAFAVIEESHGSVERYLEQEAGVDASLRSRLQQVLLETS